MKTNRLLCTQVKQVKTKRPEKIEVIFTPGTPGVIFCIHFSTALTSQLHALPMVIHTSRIN